MGSRRFFDKITFMYSQGYPLKLWYYYFYKRVVSQISGKEKRRIMQKHYNSMIWEWGFDYLEQFKQNTDEGTVYNFKNALIPYQLGGERAMNYRNFLSTFYFHFFLNNDYSEKNVRRFDGIIPEGAYCFENNEIKVTVDPGDIVIDAGSWIGDFAAFASTKGAVTYAFEPIISTYKWLEETAKLNNNRTGKCTVRPINIGLSNSNEEIEIGTEIASGSNSFIMEKNSNKIDVQRIVVTTIDDFVEKNNLIKVDFIKADIEGAERLMLEGARNTLKSYAPKLAICTYHLPDDPMVLESIIMDANPDYKVVHGREKLYAAVPVAKNKN